MALNHAMAASCVDDNEMIASAAVTFICCQQRADARCLNELIPPLWALFSSGGSYLLPMTGVSDRFPMTGITERSNSIQTDRTTTDTIKPVVLKPASEYDINGYRVILCHQLS